MNRVLFLLFMFLASCTSSTEDKKATATEILRKAYEVAGGVYWKRPQSLIMKGYGLFYLDDTVYRHETHNMWRVYESTKTDAHSANGKVRIESIRSGVPIINLSFDGTNTYDQRGRQPQSDADKRWASNFGYGVIRHALDSGYVVKRIEDDSLRNTAIFQIKVIDLNKGETTFGVDQNNFNIVKVGFDTPRGWHERIYSNFFKKEPYNWNQPGRVELFYNGTLSNEIIWKDFDINVTIPDSVFIL